MLGLFWVLKIIVLYENALSPIGRASVEHLVYSSSINIIIIKEYLLDHFSHGYCMVIRSWYRCHLVYLKSYIIICNHVHNALRNSKYITSQLKPSCLHSAVYHSGIFLEK